MDASRTHDIIRERESPCGEGGEVSGLFGVKREGLARGPRAEDHGGPHGRAEALLGLLLFPSATPR